MGVERAQLIEEECSEIIPLCTRLAIWDLAVSGGVFGKIHWNSSHSRVIKLSYIYSHTYVEDWHGKLYFASVRWSASELNDRRIHWHDAWVLQIVPGCEEQSLSQLRKVVRRG